MTAPRPRLAPVTTATLASRAPASGSGRLPRHRLDLDLEADEARLHGRPGRVRASKNSLVDLVVRREVVESRQVRIDLDDVLEPAAGRVEAGAEVLQRLEGLLGDVVGDELAVDVEGRLTGGVDEIAADDDGRVRQLRDGDAVGLESVRVGMASVLLRGT